MGLKLKNSEATGLGEEAKAFLDKFGSHLLIPSFDGMNAMQLEDLAGGISNESKGIIKPEEVQKLPLEDQRQMHDQRWLSTIAWCWAANAYAAGDNGAKFDDMIENALREYTKMPFFEEGSFLNDAKKTKAVIGAVSEQGHLNEVFNFVVNVISQSIEDVSAVNCGYSVGGKNMLYTRSNQYDFMRAGIRYAVKGAKKIGFDVPAGNKEQAIIGALTSLSMHNTPPSGGTLIMKVGSKLSSATSKITGEAKVLVEKKAELERQKASYHPADDAQIHESEAGRVRFRFGQYEFGVYDMLVNGNRMRFETRLRRAFASMDSSNVADVKYIRRDLSLPGESSMHVPAFFENLASGRNLGGYDNDNLMWACDDAGTLTQHPGAYRKNAFGVFIAKLK